ncbi:ParA family protein [Pseudothermotoga sp. U03pept]|uniref:ParA family protein n=1 Tax=Pseudothermotoga sp. U03pept TaxID=3447012 RepID=UPI003F0AAC2B
MAKIISISNRKGGVGKTTLAYNLSALLSDMGKKCLLLDLDSQAHATIHTGLEPLKIKYGVYEALIDFLNNQHVRKDVLYRQNELFVLPSNGKIAALEVELDQLPNRESVLKDFLLDYDRDFDYIFIDTPPSLGLTVINALVASQYLLVPVRLDFFSLVGLAQMMNFYYRTNATLSPSLKFLGLVPIMFSAQAKLCKEVLQELQRTFEDKMIFPILRNDIKIAEASSHGLPIHRYAPKSRAAQDIKAIAEEVLRRTN